MTYEEIKEKYPIGKLLAKEVVITERVGDWVTQADREYYLKHYKNVRFEKDWKVYYSETKIKAYYVQGWVVTDKGFFVAELTWDGWQPLDEDDLAEIEAKGIAYEF